MRILIVDDDSSVHDVIKSIISKNNLRHTVVGDAYDGAEAMSLFAKSAPELVITDMKMPTADGLTFMRWLKQKKCTCKIIVLSGYDSFAYTRNAFLLDAVDYLLKPVNSVDFINVLNHIEEAAQKEAMNSDRRPPKGLALVQEEFMSEITFYDIDDENSIIVKAHQNKVMLPENDFQIIAVKLQNTYESVLHLFNGNLYDFYDAVKTQIQKEFLDTKTIVFRQLYMTNELEIVHFLDEATVEKRVRRIRASLRKEYRIISIFGMSNPHTLEGISQAYHEAVDAMQYTKLNERDFFCTFAKRITEKSEDWDEVLDLLDCVIKNGSIYGIPDFMLRLRQRLSEESVKNLTVHEISRNLTELLKRVETIAEQSGIAEELRMKIQNISANVQKYLSNSNYVRALRHMNSFLEALPDVLERYSYSEKQFAEDVKQYIQRNCKTVNLSSISSHFFLSRNYFSTVFRGLMSTTFSEYVLEVRIKQAAYLLQNTTLSIREISSEVGYDDSRYFSQVFKKHYGMQPKEYRNAIRETEPEITSLRFSGEAERTPLAPSAEPWGDTRGSGVAVR